MPGLGIKVMILEHRRIPLGPESLPVDLLGHRVVAAHHGEDLLIAVAHLHPGLTGGGHRVGAAAKPDGRQNQRGTAESIASVVHSLFSIHEYSSATTQGWSTQGQKSATLISGNVTLPAK